MSLRDRGPVLDITTGDITRPAFANERPTPPTKPPTSEDEAPNTPDPTPEPSPTETDRGPVVDDPSFGDVLARLFTPPEPVVVPTPYGAPSSSGAPVLGLAVVGLVGVGAWWWWRNRDG